MGETITVNIDEEVNRKLREVAAAEYGKRKGYLGKAISEAAKMWIREKEVEAIRKRELEVLKRGFRMGKLLYKKREELYEK